jgi:hypothetical protein
MLVPLAVAAAVAVGGGNEAWAANNPGNNAGGQRALVKNINKILDRLGL